LAQALVCAGSGAQWTLRRLRLHLTPLVAHYTGVEMKLMKKVLLAIFISIALAPASFAQVKDGTKLRVSYSVISAASMVTWVCKDAGIFKKHGLDIDLIYIGSATKAVSATVSGDTPITQGAGTGSVLARLSGADTVWVASILDSTNQSLVVVPAIRGPQDLRGKTLGVTRYGSLSDFGVRYYLQSIGMDPDRDVKIIQMGGLPETLAAMQGGSIQGGALSSPILTKAKMLGFKELIDLSTLGIKYPATSFITTDSFLKTNRAVVTEFLKAIIESAFYVKSHKDYSISVLRKYTKIDDQPILDDTYELYIHRYIRTVPTPSPEEAKTVLAQIRDNPKARTADPASFIRTDIMADIEQSGFIRSLR
jgi:ABC-type nitrate/sulfonate/bicarbonate transport system substrate-binding protein